jgi:hypothetical protein
MKHALRWFLAGSLASATLAVALPGEKPVGLPDVKIVWKVPANVWPVDRVWIYKVVPQDFSEAVISNMMVVGSFTIADKKPLSHEASRIDKKALFFESHDATRWLAILPTLGYIDYYDRHAVAQATSTVKGLPEPVTGVPDLTQATQLGQTYLRSMGIDESLLARKPDSCELDRHWEITSREWLNPATQTNVREIQSFAIDFTRSIDGIPISGFGDLYVDFGNKARIHKLQLSWRNLKPYRLLDRFITPDQIVDSLRSGRQKLPPIEGWRSGEIKTLTITNAAPRYARKPGDEPMDFVSPSLQLDAIADNGKTNKYIWFQMGILPPK